MGKSDEGPFQSGRNRDALAIENKRKFLSKGVDSHCKASQDDYIDYHLEWERVSEGSLRNLEKRE